MAVGTIYFALVDPGTVFDGAIHNVEDEEVFSINISQSEGSFATADIEIKNPSQGLLAPTRKERAFISYQDGASVVLLFSGRVTGFPSEITGDTVSLEYIAQPDDWEIQQDAFLQTLKVAPQYEELFVPADRRDQASEILAGRAELLHWARDTNAISTSDIIQGAQFIDFGEELFFDSVNTEIGDPPVSKINLNIEVQWQQLGIGVVDAGAAIKAQFINTAVLTPEINTLTPLAFEEGWQGVSIPTGYRVAESKLTPVADDFGLVQGNLRSAVATVSGVDFPTKTGANPTSRTVTVPRVWYNGTLQLQAEYQQKRREVAAIAVFADTQNFSLKGNKEEDLNIRVENPTETLQGAVHNAKLPSFFYDKVSFAITGNGQKVIEHGLQRAMARLKKSSRIIESTFSGDLDALIVVTLDHSIRIQDDRLPGGSLRGKVIKYSFSIDGDTGRTDAKITLGAAIGSGGDSTPTGALSELEVGSVSYDNEFGATPMNSSVFYDLVVLPTIDEPIDVAQMEIDDQYLILSTAASNDGETQDAAFAISTRPDILLRDNGTSIAVNLRSMNPLPELFKQIDISTSLFSLPRQTDLEAS